MKIDLSKFAKDIQSKIQAALSDDGKISLSEMREMKLAKDVEQELMSQLAGQPDMIGDGFVRKKTEDGSTILYAGQPFQGLIEMSDSDKVNYRTRYNNNSIEEAFLQDGVMYFRDKNGEMIKGADGEYLSEKIYAEEKKLPFLDENGKIDNEKFMEYLNSLPPTDKEYTELMKDIEKASEEKSYWSIANCINSSKARCKEIFNLVKKDKYKEAGEALYSYFQEDCKAFDENFLFKVREGLTIITGSKWAGPALYNVLSDLANDEDDNHISVGERVLVTADNVGQGLGDFIFSTEGLATMGAIAGGEALLAKASSTLAPYIGAAIHSYFGVEGTMLVADGAIKAATGETLEEVAEGGQEIGQGLPLMGTVIRAGGAAVKGITEVNPKTGFSWSNPKMVSRYLKMRSEMIKHEYKHSIGYNNAKSDAWKEVKLTKYKEQILQRIAIDDNLYNHEYALFPVTIHERLAGVKIENEYQAQIINMILDNPEYYQNLGIMIFATDNLYGIKYPSQVKMFEKILTDKNVRDLSLETKHRLISPFFKTDEQANDAIELLDKILHDERLKDNNMMRGQIVTIISSVIKSGTDENVFKYRLDLLNKALENEELCADTKFMNEHLPNYIVNVTDYPKYRMAEKLFDNPELRTRSSSINIVYYTNWNNSGFVKLLLDKGVDSNSIASICERVNEIDLDFGKKVAEHPEFLEIPEKFIDVLKYHYKDPELAERLLFDKDLDLSVRSAGYIMEELTEENKNIANFLIFDKTLNFPKQYLHDAISSVKDKTTEKKYISLLQNPEIAKFVRENAYNFERDGNDALGLSDAMFLARTKRTLLAEQKSKPKTVTKTKGYSEEQKNATELFTGLGLSEKETKAVIQAISDNGLIDIVLQTKAVELINSGVPKNKIGELLNSANITGEFNSKIIDDNRAIEGVVNPFLQKHLAILNNIKKSDFVTSEAVIREYQTQRRTILAMIDKLEENVKEQLKAKGINTDAIRERLSVQMTSAKVQSKKVDVPKGFRKSKDKLKDFERIVVDKYNPPEEVWRYEDKTKVWAEDKYQDMKQRDYRSETYIDVNGDRYRILKEWFDFMDNDPQIKENPFIKILLTDAITKDLTPENAWIPPTFDKELAKEMLGKAIENSTEFSISSYNEKLKEKAKVNCAGDFVNMDGIKGRWYTVPQTDKSSKQYKENVERVRAFSDGTNWCIKTYNAEPYIQEGNIHFFIDEYGLTQVCVRENRPGKIYEIQQRHQNGAVPVPYVNIIQNFISKNKLKTDNVNHQLEEAVKVKPLFDKMKAKLQKMQADKDYIGILKYLGIDVQVREDGTYILSHYSSRIGSDILYAEEYDIYNLNQFSDFHLNDFGIREDLLLQNVSEIIKGADFENSNATALPKLEYCGRNKKLIFPGEGNGLSQIEGITNYRDSKIVDLRNLKEFNGAKVDFLSE